MSEFYFSKGVVCYKGDWITVNCSDSIPWYYSRQIEKLIGKKVSTPLHGAHISVLPGKHEPGLNKHPLWKKHEGQVVDFKYYSKIHTDCEWFTYGVYFWLIVECPMVHQIRSELGLKPNLKWPLHLTVAYRGY